MYITPLFKNEGSRLNCENYRPISKTPALCRIFETAVRLKLEEVVSNKLSNFQHGFRHNHSTITNLLFTYEYIFKKINDNINCDVLYIDFSKAFDKIPTDILLSKLNKLSVPNNLIKLIFALLDNRKQIVRIGGSDSEPLEITSGVPQGSPLSPTLFNLFIDDLLRLKFSSNICAYADDIKLFGLADGSLQADLDMIVNWSQSNGMLINIHKSCVMRFGRKKSKYQIFY